MTQDRWLLRCVALVTISIASLISLLIIGAAILHPYIDAYSNTPPILEKWGGLVIGFYFGTLAGLLKDWTSARNHTAEGKPNS